MRLSIVIATLNRLKYLQKCVDSVRRSCGNLEHEIIVVDGGSRDGTQQWLQGQPSIFTIEQGQRLGAVKAFNAGFYASEGKYVAALNDDCTVIGDTLPFACKYLDQHPECGQVAIPWMDKGDRAPYVMRVPLGHQGISVVYANFGVTRRDAGDAVGWWGTIWEHYSGDVELSFMLLINGWYVDELPGGLVEHYRVKDETRRVCPTNPQFKQRWLTFDASNVQAMLTNRNNGKVHKKHRG